MIIVRPVRADDEAAFFELARLSGPGFTSLPDDPELLRARIEKSLASFAADPTGPDGEAYLLMLEDTETGRIIGCSAVKAAVGLTKPFFNYKLFKVAQSSAQAERRFDMDVAILVNEFAGSTEVGTLFIREDARGGGVGRLAAQARYLLIAAARERFAERVIAELRGIVDADGRAPFWDHLGKFFFHMEFEEADHLSGISDNQFILDLMPKYPIYLDLLPEAARAVVGETHVDGLGARKLLEWEGFTYDRVIDIFDGGPLVSVPRDHIRTVRESRETRVEAGEPGDWDILLSTDDIKNFAVTRTRARFDADRAVVAPEALEAINITSGSTARIWVKA